jgi:hypothetical protein
MSAMSEDWKPGWRGSKLPLVLFAIAHASLPTRSRVHNLGSVHKVHVGAYTTCAVEGSEKFGENAVRLHISIACTYMYSHVIDIFANRIHKSQLSYLRTLWTAQYATQRNPLWPGGGCIRAKLCRPANDFEKTVLFLQKDQGLMK